MQKLIQLLHSQSLSCVIRQGDDTREFTSRGILDLFTLLNTYPDFLKEALVADKVVGKAAAALMCVGEVREVYADVMSQPAHRLFEAEGIKHSYRELVPHIIRRDGKGQCPMELLTADAPSVQEAVERIRIKLNETSRIK